MQHAAHDREHLIAEAKEAWKKKQAPARPSDDGEYSIPSPCSLDLIFYLHSVITDPEDPRFDLEKLIAKWEKAT